MTEETRRVSWFESSELIRLIDPRLRTMIPPDVLSFRYCMAGSGPAPAFTVSLTYTNGAVVPSGIVCDRADSWGKWRSLVFRHSPPHAIGVNSLEIFDTKGRALCVQTFESPGRRRGLMNLAFHGARPGSVGWAIAVSDVLTSALSLERTDIKSDSFIFLADETPGFIRQRPLARPRAPFLPAPLCINLAHDIESATAAMPVGIRRSALALTRSARAAVVRTLFSQAALSRAPVELIRDIVEEARFHYEWTCLGQLCATIGHRHLAPARPCGGCLTCWRTMGAS